MHMSTLFGTKNVKIFLNKWCVCMDKGRQFFVTLCEHLLWGSRTFHRNCFDPDLLTANLYDANLLKALLFSCFFFFFSFKTRGMRVCVLLTILKITKL